MGREMELVVCMDGQRDGWMDGCMHGQIWMDG